jgi:hypothetical protein
LPFGRCTECGEEHKEDVNVCRQSKEVRRNAQVLTKLTHALECPGCGKKWEEWQRWYKSKGKRYWCPECWEESVQQRRRFPAAKAWESQAAMRQLRPQDLAGAMAQIAAEVTAAAAKEAALEQAAVKKIEDAVMDQAFSVWSERLDSVCGQNDWTRSATCASVCGQNDWTQETGECCRQRTSVDIKRPPQQQPPPGDRRPLRGRGREQP